jgi:methionine synthase I (cobalamin-dependent)
MQIREVFDRKRFVFLDGGMGTQLQARGLQPGQKPELAALEMPEVLTAIHTDYANAGADILLANTFGANAKKLTGCGHTVEEVVSASIACARKAAETTGACVALDIGPLGELLVPAGTLAFEDAYNEFAQVIRAGAAAGADLVFLETMTDLYELKTAILAARENCDLPVFTSMSFESRGRTFTGCTVESYAVTAAGLGADAVGINCSLGPKEILPFAQRLCRSVPAGVPVFVKPNAGLPNPDGSYNLDPDEFAAEMKEYAAIGVSMVGGCCGTTACLALLNDAVKKGGVMASNHVGGLSGAFIPVSEDDGMINAANCGSLTLEKLEAMTAVCSVGIDMVVIPGDTSAEVISGLIADEAAIGMVNSKTTAVRVIPAIGHKAGDVLDFGGLLGHAPIMPISQFSPAVMIHRGGRIPAPMQALKN